MLTLYLCRHGNTFQANERAVWVGVRQDMPLVDAGRAQARSLAHHLQAVRIKPTAFYCSTLQRTRQYAEIVRHDLGLTAMPLLVREELDEIDYGAWSGLSAADIRQRFGADMLREWQEEGLIPPNGIFNSTEPELRDRISHLAADLVAAHGAGETVVVIASNGILRYFLKLTADTQAFHEAVQSNSLSVKTGHYGIMTHDPAANGFHCVTWNRNPAEDAEAAA
jgi:broad specificity phosphatase PhoE